MRILLGGWRCRQRAYLHVFERLSTFLSRMAMQSASYLVSCASTTQLNSTQTPNHNGLRKIWPPHFFNFFGCYHVSQVTVFLRTARGATCWLGGVSSGLGWIPKSCATALGALFYAVFPLRNILLGRCASVYDMSSFSSTYRLQESPRQDE